MQKLTLAPFVLSFLIVNLGCEAQAPTDSRAGYAESDRAGKADLFGFFNTPEEESSSVVEEEYEDDGEQAVDQEASLPEGDIEVNDFTLILPESCISPCTIIATSNMAHSSARVEFEADGFYLGSSQGLPATIHYPFMSPGNRQIHARLFWGQELIAESSGNMLVGLPESCESFDSINPDESPIQVTGDGAPKGALALNWITPAASLMFAPFAGNPGQPALHEGVDYIHDDSESAYIPVVAASEGMVVYVRSGCPQSSMFNPNIDGRECGSGWGNHVVIDHGNGIHTRYAHLAPGTINVVSGQEVLAGDLLGEMGNTGRSETRHLHLELGVTHSGFDPCAPSQSLDTVHDPASVGL